MLDVRPTSRFKRDLKKVARQGKDLAKFKVILDLLQSESALPESNRDHTLSGRFAGQRECHIAPDWPLIYKVDGPFLVLVRTGSHSELFG